MSQEQLIRIERKVDAILKLLKNIVSVPFTDL